MVPRASFWAKGQGTGVDYNIEIRFGNVKFIFPAKGKTHAIDIVAAINLEEPIDEYGQKVKRSGPPAGSYPPVSDGRK